MPIVATVWDGRRFGRLFIALRLRVSVKESTLGEQQTHTDSMTDPYYSTSFHPISSPSSYHPPPISLIPFFRLSSQFLQLLVSWLVVVVLPS